VALTLIVQSQLVGCCADLPPPLGKQAIEPMPLRVERVVSRAPAGDSITVSLGTAVEAYFSGGAWRQYVTAAA